MKWFKADTDGYESEKICELEATLGLASVAQFYFLLMIIAKKMDSSNRCHAEFPLDKWCQLLRFKQATKFHKFCDTLLKVFNKDCETSDEISVETSKNFVKISIPKLLKKKDNYSKDLEETWKKLPSPKTESEQEKEKKETQSPKPPSAKKENPDRSNLSGNLQTRKPDSVKTVSDALGEKPKTSKPEKHAETPLELTSQIIEYLRPFTDQDNENQVSHKIKLKIQEAGMDFVRMRFIEMKEREADSKAPPVRTRIGYFLGSMNGAKK